MRRAESAINSYGLRHTTRAGWVPTINTYRGYGTSGRIRVIGRVLMEPIPEETDRDKDTAIEKAQRGYRQFFTVQVADIPIYVDLPGRRIENYTNDNGYFDVLIDDHGLEPGWHSLTVGSTHEQVRPAQAEVMVTGDKETIGLISDIDDTIMVTNLPRAVLAAYNSWVKHTNKRRPVPGMARFYRELLDGHPDAPVFYLSTGAWNTFDTVAQFIKDHSLPTGPLLLTDWGPTPTGLFRNGIEHKRVQLRNLIIDYPHIQWLLVGDNGQHDPWTYVDIVAEHPDAIAGVAIRELTAAEHLLSHGTASALTGPKRIAVPSISAPDGYGLLSKLPVLRKRIAQTARGTR